MVIQVGNAYPKYNLCVLNIFFFLRSALILVEKKLEMIIVKIWVCLGLVFLKSLTYECR